MAAALLLSVRLFAILRAQVLWRHAVGPLWWLVAAGLSGLVGLGGLATPVGAAPPHDVGILDVVFELLLGTVLGIVASLPGFALVGAAAASAAPFGAAARSLAALFVILTLAIAMALGLHQALLRVALDTAAAFAVGEPHAWVARADALVLARAAHAMLVLALALATPVLLVAAIAEVCLRVVGRGPAGSESPSATSSAIVRGAAALVALGAAWQAYGRAWAEAAVGVAP